MPLPANYLNQPVPGYMKTDASGLVLTVNGKSMTVPVGATFSPETLETIRGYLAAATDNLAYCSYPVAPVIRICDQVLTIDPARLLDYVDRELMEREDMLRSLEKKPQLIAEEYDAMDGLESSARSDPHPAREDPGQCVREGGVHMSLPIKAKVEFDEEYGAWIGVCKDLAVSVDHDEYEGCKELLKDEVLAAFQKEFSSVEGKPVKALKIRVEKEVTTLTYVISPDTQTRITEFKIEVERPAPGESV